MKKEEAKMIAGEIFIKEKELEKLQEELKGLRMAELGRKLETKPEEVWFEGQSPVQEISRKPYNFGYDEEKPFRSPDTLGENYFKKIVQKIRDLRIVIEESKKKIQNYN